MKNWCVYIVECSDKSLYTGITNNLVGRIQAHNKGTGANYTRSRLPVKLFYSEPAKSHSEALKREVEIKKWPRIKKLKLSNNS